MFSRVTKRGFLTLALLLLGSFISASHANAFLFSTFPECHQGKVLKKIKKRFNWADRRTWHRDIRVVDITNPHGHGRYGFPDSSIPRRYCHAYAHLNNGERQKVYYLIEQRMGLAGFGWNVEFCIPKYDRWRIYDGYCRTVRPRY